MMGKTSKKSMIYAIFFVAAINVAILALLNVPFIKYIPSALMLPGVTAVYSWASVHDGWAYLLVQIVNVIFYYALFFTAASVYRRFKRG